MAARHENRAKGGGFNYAPETKENAALSQYKIGEKVSFIVRIQKQIYWAEKTGWAIYLVEKNDRWFKISGTFAAPLPAGSYYKIAGSVREYRGERDIAVKSYQSAAPANKESILNVLSSIEDLNASAYSIYRKYGPTILQDIITHPERVAFSLEIPEEQVKRWRAYLKRHQTTEDLFSKLKEYGIGDAAAKQLIDQYGAVILDKIKSNPYFLIDEIQGLSFQKCDEAALAHGYPFDGQQRIMYGILSTLKRAAYEGGHCYLPEGIFMQEVQKTLNKKLGYREAYKLYKESEGETILVQNYGIESEIPRAELYQAMMDWQQTDKKESFRYEIVKLPEQALHRALAFLIDSNRVVCKTEPSGEKLYMLSYYARAEQIIAHIAADLSCAEFGSFRNNKAVLNRICEEKGIVLEQKQYQAALRFTKARGGLFILNGAAGCGKTFVLNVIIETLKKLHKDRHMNFKAKILAPTGKAAQVAHTATGIDAFTIHRELGHIQNGSLRQQDERIHADCLIVDEFSMVDVLLAAELFEHISPATKVIILGDTNQLPSIGPGAVLKDLLDSQKIETVTLDVIKRQTDKSGILTNANRILAGQALENMVSGQDGDAYVIEKDNPEEIRQTMLNLFEQSVQEYGLANVQILCPQKKSKIGTEVMNYCLQQMINPDKPGEKKVFAKRVSYKAEDGTTVEKALYYKVGDKVIHTKNNYNMPWYSEHSLLGLTEDHQKKGIINGETGVITAIKTPEEGQKKTKIIVKYDGGYVMYEDNFDELDHAYAITIHKAQGSQWSVVIAPFAVCNYRMLNRKLAYTLYTRAQKRSYVVGERRAMDQAVQNNENARRYTTLSQTFLSPQ